MGMFAVNVGLFVPYRHGEATYSACALAQTLGNMNYDTTLITTDRLRNFEIHYAYDRSARSLHDNTIESCCVNNKNVIWFCHQRRLLARLRASEPQQRHIVVVSRDQLKYEPESLREYDVAVCARRDVYDGVLHWRRSHASSVAAVHLTWDSELALRNRFTPVSPDGVRLLAVFDSRTSRVDTALTALKQLLQRHKRMTVTVWHTTKWDKRANNAVLVLSLAFPGRVFTVRSPTAIQRWELFRQHDCAWFAEPSYDYAPLVADALACHCPVIAYDVSPLNDMVLPHENGCLLQCRIRPGLFGIRDVKVTDEAVCEQISAYIGRQGDMRKQRAGDWPQREIRRRNYQNTWNRLLCGESVGDDDDAHLR